MSKKRLDLFDTATGITMIVVVFGHNYFDEFMHDAWYGPLRYFVYQFHMSVFMFLSGFLIFYAYRPIHSGSDYRQYIGKRIKKFVPAYLFFSLLFILINLLLNKISLQQIPDQLYRMALTPAQSSATFLWYLYVLLII
jgi:fucose 4-O-acetylase-like acetyltransferase